MITMSNLENCVFVFEMVVVLILVGTYIYDNYFDK